MIADLLFGTQRRRALSLLILNPNVSLHVREIARQTGTQAGSLNRELRTLADAGLLVRTKVGNQVHYQANRACPVFEELAGLLRKTTGIAAVVAEALAPLADRIEIALIFGSVARGMETTHSDVDVLILSEIRFFDAVEVLHPAQAKLGREINPAVYPVEEFRTKVLDNDTWACTVISNPKIFLIGTDERLVHLVSDTPASAPSIS